MKNNYESRTRAAVVAKVNAYAFVVLAGALVAVIYGWYFYNRIIAIVWDIPPAMPRSEASTDIEFRAGTLPFPTPWWVGAIIVAGFAVLLATSWKREHQIHAYRTMSPVIGRITPGMLVIATAVLALGSIMLGGYYTPGELFSPWHFVAASSAAIAVVAHVHRVRQNREYQSYRGRTRRRG